MKLCPFISHMLGDESSSVLTIDPSKVGKNPKNIKNSEGIPNDVVILGYDDKGGTGVQTKTAQAAATKKTSASSHLFCLKEPCRFFTKSGRCMPL